MKYFSDQIAILCLDLMHKNKSRDLNVRLYS